MTTDVGQHQMWTAQVLRLDKRNRWLTSGGASPWALVCLCNSVHGSPQKIRKSGIAGDGRASK